MVCENGFGKDVCECNDATECGIIVDEVYPRAILNMIDSYVESPDFELISKMDYEAEMQEGNLTGPAVEGIKRIQKMFGGDRHAALNAMCIALNDKNVLSAVMQYYVTHEDLWDCVEAWGALQNGRVFE